MMLEMEEVAWRSLTVIAKLDIQNMEIEVRQADEQECINTVLPYLSWWHTVFFLFSSSDL